MAPDGPTKLNNHHMMTGSDATGILRTGATDTVVVGRLPQLPACPMTAAVLNLADHDFID
ncbi:MAG TPA: hypothetical protein VK550_25205 [Polyangiaceae bacterium]|nr:hypothetical protein [Polyangiaceae bacterium]